MCEISYVNIHSPELNRLMVYLLTGIGSSKHDDGTGIMCSNNAIWKTKLEAKIITNYGACLFRDIKDDLPIPAHIRKATWGIEVTDENAHPFASNNYILMHNGTLELKEEKAKKKDTKRDSDSETFLNYLEEARKEKSDSPFEDIFKHAMEHFTGKFAFVIRDKGVNTDYIIRGKTANLYISEIRIKDQKKIRGYVVNTNDITMKEAFHHFINLTALTYGVNYEFSDPKLLEQESIFVSLPYGIKKIANAKEESPVTKSDNYWDRMRHDRLQTVSPIKSTIKSTSNNSDSAKIIGKAQKIYEFLDKHGLSFLDLQLIVSVIGGISLLEMNEQDVDFFIDYMIPKLSFDKKQRKSIKAILNGGVFPSHLYKDYDLEYPWVLNDKAKVMEAINSLKK
jgi:predicted glutamine amidotransferase